MAVYQILYWFELNSQGRNNSSLDFQIKTKIDVTHLKSTAATLVCFLNKWKGGKQECSWGKWRILFRCWLGPNTETGRPWQKMWDRRPLGRWEEPVDTSGPFTAAMMTQRCEERHITKTNVHLHRAYQNAEKSGKCSKHIYFARLIAHQLYFRSCADDKKKKKRRRPMFSFGFSDSFRA